MRRSARQRIGARNGKAGTENGFTLVELMISMALGLIVVGGVISVMLANKRTYRSTEGLSQLQESARTAFELLARDSRQGGASGCDSSGGRIANVLTAGTTWWQNWFGIAGYESSTTDPAVATGTAAGERVAGTDSITLQSIEGTGLSVKTHDAANAKFALNAASSSITAGDVLMVCDFDHAAIFQVSSYDGTKPAVEVTYTDGVGTPGNCSKGLGYPTNCGSSTGNVYPFNPNSQIARFTAVDWYIGNNGRAAEGGRSLYRRRLGSGGVVVTEEVVAGVTDMQIKYRVSGTDTFVDASAVTAGNWANVNALAITLVTTSADQRVSTDLAVNSGRLQRTFTWLVTLRNRVP
jgi:type IV pilus assembly protein PilW